MSTSTRGSDTCLGILLETTVPEHLTIIGTRLPAYNQVSLLPDEYRKAEEGR